MDHTQKNSYNPCCSISEIRSDYYYPIGATPISRIRDPNLSNRTQIRTAKGGVNPGGGDWDAVEGKRAHVVSGAGGTVASHGGGARRGGGDGRSRRVARILMEEEAVAPFERRRRRAPHGLRLSPSEAHGPLPCCIGHFYYWASYILNKILLGFLTIRGFESPISEMHRPRISNITYHFPS